MNVLLWGVLPYIALAILIGGTIWRYRYDQFGWTTRSSQPVSYTHLTLPTN